MTQGEQDKKILIVDDDPDMLIAMGAVLESHGFRVIEAHNGEEALEKLGNQKEAKIKAAQEQAEKERIAIDNVENELLNMLHDPELRKRYFSVVDMEELEENEFNLNIPRYVDTFEPEEEIDLKQAITEFKATLGKETALDKSIDELLKALG